jgi:predicted nucleic acid-binding protein
VNAYWDSSAVLALIYREPHSEEATRAASATQSVYAWWWMRIETHAAMQRRGFSTLQEKNWLRFLDATCWIDMPQGKADEICRFNAMAKLRSADAGHLFIFSQLEDVVENLTLVTFDAEMASAAATKNWKVWDHS